MSGRASPCNRTVVRYTNRTTVHFLPTRYEMSTATQPLAGRFQADPVHSSFGFAVKHMGVNTFRGTLADVDASYVDGVLEGRAKVESISIVNPPEFRAHVLGE